MNLPRSLCLLSALLIAVGGQNYPYGPVEHQKQRGLHVISTRRKTKEEGSRKNNKKEKGSPAPSVSSQPSSRFPTTRFPTFSPVPNAPTASLAPSAVLSPAPAMSVMLTPAPVTDPLAALTTQVPTILVAARGASLESNKEPTDVSADGGSSDAGAIFIVPLATGAVVALGIVVMIMSRKRGYYEADSVSV